MKPTPQPHGALEQALGAVVEALERRRLRYALIGGLALAQHGVIRATQDVDLLLSLSQWELGAVLTDLQAAGFSFDMRQTIREWREDHITQIELRGVRIDWLEAVLPAFRQVLDEAIVRKIGGRNVKVVSFDGAVVLKLIAFREQDKADVRALLVANEGNLEAQPVKDALLRVFEADDPRLTWFEDAVRKLG